MHSRIASLCFILLIVSALLIHRVRSDAVSAGDSTATPTATSAGALVPPVRVFGEISKEEEMVPALVPITALIDGKVCGQGLTQIVDGLSTYFIDVAGDDPGTSDPDCGREGATIEFLVNSEILAQAIPWTSMGPIEVALVIEGKIPATVVPTATPTPTDTPTATFTPFASSTNTPTITNTPTNTIVPIDTPNTPGTREPLTPDPGTPDPGTPGPGTPGPSTPGPVTPVTPSTPDGEGTVVPFSVFVPLLAGKVDPTGLSTDMDTFIPVFSQ